MFAHLTFIGVALLQICSIQGEFDEFTVVVSFFAGVENPEWTVKDNEGLTDLLVTAKENGQLGLPSQMPAILGYRGMLIEDISQNFPKVLLLGPKTAKLQLKILDTMPEGKLLEGDVEDIKGAIEGGQINFREPEVYKIRGKRYAPPYQPAVWNANAATYRRQRCNNCYNYASRRATDNFAQPGFGSGRKYTRNAGGALIANPHTGANLIAACERDGLTQLHPHPLPGQPVPGALAHAWHHLIALVVKPDTRRRSGDFHFYRLDNSQLWSHKPGETQVTQRDNAGALIRDPRACALAGYAFVRFMVVDPLANTINGHLVCPVL